MVADFASFRKRGSIFPHGEIRCRSFHNKAEIKLAASNKVVEKYSDFLTFVYSYYSELILLLSQDPREQTQTVINEETGDEYEQTTATDTDILIFEGRVRSVYKELHADRETGC